MNYRANFLKDPLNLKGKIILFKRNIDDFFECCCTKCIQSMSKNKQPPPHAHGYELNEGCLAIVDDYCKSGKQIKFHLNFKNYEEHNIKLFKSTWSDYVDDNLVENLKWNECPSFWKSDCLLILRFDNIFNLPFVPVE